MQKNNQLQLNSAKSQGLSHLNLCHTRSKSFTDVVLEVESCSWNMTKFGIHHRLESCVSDYKYVLIRRERMAHTKVKGYFDYSSP